MKRLVFLAGLAGLAAIALLIAQRGTAWAREPAGCAPAEGYLPAFCVNVPFTLVRHETTVPMHSLPSQRADVRVEVSLPGSDVAALTVDVDRSVERVEALIGRTFSARPRVLLFATSASFAQGARELFGYAAATARYVANTYGGIFDRPTLTIALNWSAADRERMSAAVAHELTHLLIHDITAGHDLPAWLDEGLATEIEERSGVDEALTGRAIAASGTVSLAEIDALADWHLTYARLGRPLYAYAAEVVRAMESRVALAGVVATLEAVGRGERFAAAYLRISGETVTELERRVARSSAPAIASGAVDASGSVRWTLFSGAAGAEVTVSLSGPSGYSLTFTVRTDGLGMYRGSFGATAAPGTYTVRAAGAVGTLVTGR